LLPRRRPACLTAPRWCRGTLPYCPFFGIENGALFYSGKRGFGETGTSSMLVTARCASSPWRDTSAGGRRTPRAARVVPRSRKRVQLAGRRRLSLSASAFSWAGLTYKRDYGEFQRWCQNSGKTALPCSRETIVAYVSHLCCTPALTRRTILTSFRRSTRRTWMQTCRRAREAAARLDCGAPAGNEEGEAGDHRSRSKPTAGYL